MQGKNMNRGKGSRQRHREGERGIAMVTALLLLLLLTGLSVAMVMSVKSDLLVNRYYRNFRGSFYAADSGLNIARTAMLNKVQTDLNSLPTSYNPTTTLPLTASGSNSEDAQVVSFMNSTYTSWQPVTGTGQGDAVNAWPEQFEVVNTTANPISFTPASFVILCSANCNSVPAVSNPFIVCTPASSGSGTTGTGYNCPFTTSPQNATGYEYIYNYTLTVQGRSSGSEVASVSESGDLTVKAVIGSTQSSFAAWGMFINTFNICSGTLVPGNIYGPVFTNGSWTFGTSGQYVFQDTVGQAGADFGYQFSGGCNQVAAGSDSQSGQTIAPTFGNGFNLKQNQVPLPSDSFSQEQAVVDGRGTTSFNQSSPGNLRTMSGTAFPTSGTVPNGVYLPYTGTGSTAQFTGGGILVQGDATVTLTSSSTNGVNNEVYTITQASTNTTTTITITPGSQVSTGTTQVTQKVGNTTTNFPAINGVPTMYDPTTGAPISDSTMLYVNGNITALSGPSSGAAIQNNTNITVTAADNITITGNITYATEPVTLTATGSGSSTIPADTLTTSASQSGVLGIFTAGTGCVGQSGCGNINLNVPGSNQNLEIDASIASISSQNQGGLVNTGNSINTLTIVGGRIQNTIQNIGATTRNVFFDKRFSTGGFAPPWFPSTTITNTGYTATPTVQRLVWTNNTSFL